MVKENNVLGNSTLTNTIFRVQGKTKCDVTQIT